MQASGVYAVLAVSLQRHANERAKGVTTHNSIRLTLIAQWHTAAVTCRYPGLLCLLAKAFIQFAQLKGRYRRGSQGLGCGALCRIFLLRGCITLPVK